MRLPDLIHPLLAIVNSRHEASSEEEEEGKSEEEDEIANLSTLVSITCLVPHATVGQNSQEAGLK